MKKFPNKEKRTDLFKIAIICLMLGAIIRIAFCAKYSVPPRDAYDYKNVLVSWETAESLNHFSYFPLSLWIFSLPNKFFGYEVNQSGLIVNMIAGLLIILLGIIISNMLFHNHFVSLFVGTTLATHPLLIRFSCVMLRENTYLLFLLFSFFFFTKYIKKMFVIYLLATSFFISLAFLCRLEGIETLFYFSVFLFFYSINHPPKIKRVLCHYPFFVATFIVTSFLISHCLGFKISLDQIFVKFNV